MTSNNTMNTTHTSSPISYSSVVNTFKQPTKDEAIVLSSIEGTKVQEYIIAVGVGSIVGPRNVSFASRIANNRICIYLSSKNMVDSLLHSHKYVNIKETQVEIRRIITSAQRLIISNAGPTVPTSLIEQELRKMGINAVSKITFLRVGMPESEYSHVLGFRIQTFIIPLENMSIPDSFMISHDNTTYRLYLSIEGFNCSKCKNIGHQETECSDNANTTTSNTTNPDPTNSNPTTSNTTNPDPTNSNPTTSNALPETSQNTQSTTNISYNQTEQKYSDKALISTSNEHPATSQNILTTVQVSNSQLEPTMETEDTSRSINNTNETNTLKIPTSSTSNNISNPTPLEIPQPPIIPNVTKQLKRLISYFPEINQNTTQTDSQIFTSPVARKSKKKTKTSKRNSCEELLFSLETIKDKIANRSPPFVLNYDEICDFLENTLNAKHPEITSKDYSNKTTGLFRSLILFTLIPTTQS
ncbi:uncharacterized protein LOC126892267 [Diabrotica virgifera virgifera]|uniref:Uncharacterized protein n=1 Tax=Diabrotica virgifera virgifera TaxID=50390 RepID=A0ABM5L5M5_DIAVI|nr:uncharacterized protein LOC126892267 [Diabrotica virgifera virgifera]